jgi:hypothetical protein
MSNVPPVNNPSDEKKEKLFKELGKNDEVLKTVSQQGDLVKMCIRLDELRESVGISPIYSAK